ncbi:MAG: type II secretion system minor pseudopilin GspK, partial [Nitrospinota bacterium]
MQNKRTAVSEQGIALVMVLWLMVLLVVLASQFALSARTGLETVRNLKEDREAYFLAYAGVQMAVREIVADSEYHYYGEKGQLRFASTLYDGDYSSRTEIPLGDGLVSYSIKDEGAKLNLNSLATDESQLRFLLQTLFPEGKEWTDTVADSILDWVDADDDHRANGAETDYYRTREPPYAAKNRTFDTLNELKKVKGITQEIFDALSRVVTVYPTSGVNVNTAPVEVLRAGGMPDEEIATVMKERETKGWYSDGAKSDLFAITATGRFSESRLIHSIRVIARQ